MIQVQRLDTDLSIRLDNYMGQVAQSDMAHEYH